MSLPPQDPTEVPAKPERPGILVLLLVALLAILVLDWVLWGSFGASVKVLPRLGIRSGLTLLLCYQLAAGKNWARVTLMVLMVLAMVGMVWTVLVAELSRSSFRLGALQPGEQWVIAYLICLPFIFGWMLYVLSRGDVRAWYRPGR